MSCRCACHRPKRISKGEYLATNKYLLGQKLQKSKKQRQHMLLQQIVQYDLGFKKCPPMIIAGFNHNIYPTHFHQISVKSISSNSGEIQTCLSHLSKTTTCPATKFSLCSINFEISSKPEYFEKSGTVYPMKDFLIRSFIALHKCSI